MKTNTFSALVLSLVACFSAGCMNGSPIDATTDGSIVDVQDSSDHAPDSIAHDKPSAAQQMVIPPSALPYGASYEDWAAAYWQWVMAIPAEKSPILDAPCEHAQSGDVFFLAGTRGGGHTRECKIPMNKGIFIPLLSTVSRSCPEMADSAKVCQGLTSETDLRNSAESTINEANPLLRLAVDGKVIPILDTYRVQSDLFADTSSSLPNERLFPTCSGPIETNVCGVPEGASRDAVSDGYFVMLRPLAEGPHRIEIAANVSPDSSEPPVDLVYEITVASPDSGGVAY